MVPSYLLKIPFCLARNKKHRFQAIKKPEIVSRMALFVDVDHPLTDFDQSGHALCSKPQSRTCKSAILIERVAIKSLWKMIKRNSLNLPIIPTEKRSQSALRSGNSFCSMPLWGFPKWWYPITIGVPTKNDHFGVFWGYFRKHPYGLCLKRSFFFTHPRLTCKIGFTHRVSQQTRPAPLYVSPLPQVPTSNVDEPMLRDILPCLEKKHTNIS